MMTTSYFNSLLIIVALVTAAARANAAVVLTYTGVNYSIAQSPFTTADRITGTATFANIGDTSATSVTLNTTLNGLTGFSITDSTGPVGTFAWSGNSLVSWSVDVFGNVTGGSGDEQLGATSGVGDFAAIDLGTGTESVALNSSSGTWSSATAVPEPASVLAMSVLFAAATSRCLLRKRMASPVTSS